MIPVEWRDIPSCPWYEASNDWRIRRKAYELVPSDMNWYRIVCPWWRDNNYPVSVHRLVMEAFEWESDLVVNHKDWNRANNHLENLEYTTQSENLRHARSILWKKFWFMKWHKYNKRSIPIYAYKGWVLYKKYNSWVEASKDLWIAQPNIASVISWKRKSIRWFTFVKCI